MVSALNLGNYTYVPPGPPLIFLLEVLFKYSDGYWLVEGLDSRVATILTKLHYSLFTVITSFFDSSFCHCTYTTVCLIGDFTKLLGNFSFI